jgi:hypothetical protein
MVRVSCGRLLRDVGAPSHFRNFERYIQIFVGVPGERKRPPFLKED